MNKPSLIAFGKVQQAPHNQLFSILIPFYVIQFQAIEVLNWTHHYLWNRTSPNVSLSISSKKYKYILKRFSFKEKLI